MVSKSRGAPASLQIEVNAEVQNIIESDTLAAAVAPTQDEIVAVGQNIKAPAQKRPRKVLFSV